jgi:hypothetical protein
VFTYDFSKTVEATVEAVCSRFRTSRRKFHLQENRGNEALLAEDASVGEELELATLPVVAHPAPRVSVVLRVRHGPLLHQLLPVPEVVPLVKCEVAEIPGPSDWCGVNPEFLTDKINDADFGLWSPLPLVHAAATS